MKTIDVIALIVTATTALILLVAVVSPLITGVPLSDGKASMVAGLVTSFMAILSIYVGAAMKSTNPPNDPGE